MLRNVHHLRNLASISLVFNCASLISSQPFTFVSTGRLEIAGHDEDLRSYVNDRILQEKLIARHTAADPSLHKLIVERVVSNAESMYASNPPFPRSFAANLSYPGF